MGPGPGIECVGGGGIVYVGGGGGVGTVSLPKHFFPGQAWLSG